MTPSTPTTVRISDRTAAAVRRGHPWVYRDGLFEAPPGTLLQLVDTGDRPVGWGLADDGPIAVRVLGRGRAPSEPASRWLAERIRHADGVRPALIPTETDCWRVVNGAGDGLPGLVVDRYAELAVVRIYARAWVSFLPLITRTLASLAWVTTVYRRFGVERVDGLSGGETLHGPAPSERMVVRECGIQLLVRPMVGQKTGMFLDQREHRTLVRRWAAGRRVANLFAYTGGFSVAAALGGAASVVTVDVAPEAIADAREIFTLNGLDPDDYGFEVSDAFGWRPRGTLDLLVLDPPSLARARTAERAARSAYRKLHRHHGPTVARGGLLATSSCTARLTTEEWRAAVVEGLSAGDWSWIWSSHEPPDHATALSHDEARYLKFGVLRRR